MYIVSLIFGIFFLAGGIVFIISGLQDGNDYNIRDSELRWGRNMAVGGIVLIGFAII